MIGSEFDYKTSYGSKKSRFDSYPRKVSDNQTRVRFAVGYEEESSQSILEKIKIPKK